MSRVAYSKTRAVGAWGARRLADRYGRIRVMVLASVFLVSAFGSGLASGRGI